MLWRAVAIEHLIKEIQDHFLAHTIMDALGLVYPQYWLNGDLQALFRFYLNEINP